MKDFDPNNPEHCREWLEMNGRSSNTILTWDVQTCERYRIGEHALALGQAKRITEKCRWTLKQGTIGQYSVANCTGKETGLLGSAIAAGYKTCPYCGHPIGEVPFKESAFENPTKGLNMTVLPIKKESNETDSHQV